MTSLFTKACAYDRPHENAKTVFSKQMKTIDEHDLFVPPQFTKVCVYDRPHEGVKTAFSEVYTLSLESVSKCMRLG